MTTNLVRSLEEHGKIIRIDSVSKAIVLFNYKGKEIKAVLRTKNLLHDGVLLPLNHPIQEIVPLGTEVCFIAHQIRNKTSDDCDFIITQCWKMIDLKIITDPEVEIFHGFCIQPCYFSHHEDGYGVAHKKNDPTQLIKFFYPKVYIKGAQYKEGLIEFSSKVEMQCDALPTPFSEEDGTCWTALQMWRGKRPALPTDDVSFRVQPSLLDNMKQITGTPQSIFLRSHGQILTILNKEFGIALVMIKTNQWETVIFHASNCQLFQLSLKNVNLKPVFQPGDRVKIIAARAPKTLFCEWVASHVSVHVDPSIRM